MKNLFIILFCILTISYASANDSLNEVSLDVSEPNMQYVKKGNVSVDKIDLSNIEEDSFNSAHNINTVHENLYDKKSVTNKIQKNIGKAEFGIKYDTTIQPESVSQNRTLFTKYNLNEKMSVNSTYKANTLNGLAEQTKGTAGIGTEYQMNKKLKLKNGLSKNFGNNSNKAEMSLEYKPFKDGRMDFNAGAAQVYQQTGSGSSSQVNFGTNIRF